MFPNNSDLEKFDPNNNLWKKDFEKCCDLRKVKPLDKVLKIMTLGYQEENPTKVGKEKILDHLNQIMEKLL